MPPFDLKKKKKTTSKMWGLHLDKVNIKCSKNKEIVKSSQPTRICQI